MMKIGFPGRPAELSLDPRGPEEELRTQEPGVQVSPQVADESQQNTVECRPRHQFASSALG